MLAHANLFKSAVYPVCACHDNDTAGEIYFVLACPLSSFEARLLISVSAYDGVKLKELNYETTAQTKDFIYLQKNNLTYNKVF